MMGTFFPTILSSCCPPNHFYGRGSYIFQHCVCVSVRVCVLKAQEGKKNPADAPNVRPNLGKY